MRPSAHAFSMISCGHVPSLSYSHATGRISLAAKSCAISRSAFCSSVRVKSTTCLGSSGSYTIDWSVNVGADGTPSAEESPQHKANRGDQHKRRHERQRVLV